MTIKQLIRNFRTDENGATAIEYGLIVGIIAAALISVFSTGLGVGTLYDTISAVVTAMS